MTDSSAGLQSSLDAPVYAGSSDNSAATNAFQDQFHEYMQGKFAAGNSASDKGTSAQVMDMVADNGGSSGFGTALSYAGYITYIGLAASAFGHDDPLNLETRASRYFQEKLLHHHAIDNPQVWAAMGDALMTEQHLAGQGAHFKPVKLKTLDGEIKHESAEQKKQDKDVEHYSKDANDIIKEITSGLKSPDDYVLAAKFLYNEAIKTADARATKEGVDHKDEKRLLGRFNLLSGETDRTDAMGTRDNSINPLLDELGSRVSYRLDAANLMERYGSKVPELGWTKEAEDLRAQAKAIYDDPKALSEPVRQRLHQRYSDTLTDQKSANI